MFSLQTSRRGTELQLSCLDLISLTCKQVFNSLGSQQPNSYSDMESCLSEHLCYNNCFVTWCNYHMYVLFAFNCCTYPEFSKCRGWHMMYVDIYRSLHNHLFSILLFLNLLLPVPNAPCGNVSGSKESHYTVPDQISEWVYCEYWECEHHKMQCWEVQPLIWATLKSSLKLWQCVSGCWEWECSGSGSCKNVHNTTHL